MESSRHRRQVEVMEPAYKLLTVEDFLDCCPSDQRHYQLFHGIMVAMAPPGGRHQRIAGVLGGGTL
jgi:Uma2 family endonuclease